MPFKDKEKQRAYKQAYHQAHKDEINAKKRAYRKLNPDKIKAWRETYPTYYQDYYQANKDKLKARVTIWQKTNFDKTRAWAKNWKKANPDKQRETNRKRRALKYKTQIQPINEKEVYLRDGWICQICKKRVDKRFKYPNPMSASLDHIIPLSKGGTHTYKNVQLVHLVCNISKRDRALPQGEQLRVF